MAVYVRVGRNRRRGYVSEERAIFDSIFGTWSRTLCARDMWLWNSISEVFGTLRAGWSAVLERKRVADCTNLEQPPMENQTSATTIARCIGDTYALCVNTIKVKGR